jgi:hypothetical protein
MADGAGSPVEILQKYSIEGAFRMTIKCRSAALGPGRGELACFCVILRATPEGSAGRISMADGAGSPVEILHTTYTSNIEY